MEFVCIVVVSTPGAGHRNGPKVSSATREEEAMEYLKDLIERLGKALRIKSPSQAPTVSASTNHLGPVEGPARDPR
jgi:hypothetical protein